MIDIDLELFQLVSTKLREEFNPIYVFGDRTREPAMFPAVQMTELDNRIVRRTQDTGSVENHASITYEFNIFSNKEVGKKSEARLIASVINETMGNMGFTRRMLEPVENLDKPEIYRLVGRYTATVDKNKRIYRG